MSSVKDRILDEAAEKAGQISREFQQSAEKLRAEFESEYNRLTRDNEEKLDELFESEMNRYRAMSRLEQRKRILGAKREIMKELAASVKQRISGDPEIYRTFLERGILKGVETGFEEIIVSPEERNLFNEEFLNRINSLVGELTDIKGGLRLSEITRDTGGGLFLRDGKQDFNATIPVAVESAVEEFETELVNMLFGEV